MTLTEFEEQVKKKGDTVEIDGLLFYELMSDVSIIKQTADTLCLSEQIPNKKARDAFNRICEHVDDFMKLYLESIGVKEE